MMAPSGRKVTLDSEAGMVADGDRTMCAGVDGWLTAALTRVALKQASGVYEGRWASEGDRCLRRA